MRSDDEIQRLCDAATPGPWSLGPVLRGELANGIWSSDSDTLQFIVAARDLVPELLARAQRAEAQRNYYEANTPWREAWESAGMRAYDELVADRDRLAAELTVVKAENERLSLTLRASSSNEVRFAAELQELRRDLAEARFNIETSDEAGRRSAAELAEVKAENERLTRVFAETHAEWTRAIADRNALAAQVRAVQEWASINEIAQPPLDWAGLGAALASGIASISTQPSGDDELEGNEMPNYLVAALGSKTRVQVLLVMTGFATNTREAFKLIDTGKVFIDDVAVDPGGPYTYTMVSLHRAILRYGDRSVRLISLVEKIED